MSAVVSGLLRRPLLLPLLFLVIPGCVGRENIPAQAADDATELPIKQVSGFYSAAEAYFSPDGTRLILNARLTAEETNYHVYTVALDGSDILQVNAQGADACSYYFPDGQRLILTSTRDNPHLPAGDYSDPNDYPAGAELYVANLDGSGLHRLTNNQVYEAEVSVSPDGRWILFTRQMEGRLDLWRMRPDGSNQFQITHTTDLQEGGAFYLPDSKTIIFRAWKIADQRQRGMPMTIYTISHDGADLKQITHERGTNWSPHPSPDGHHFVFVKVVAPRNYEVFLMRLDTGKQTRLTYSDAFDAFPSFAPDGHTVAFSSTRNQEPGSRRMAIYLMDIRARLE